MYRQTVLHIAEYNHQVIGFRKKSYNLREFQAIHLLLSIEKSALQRTVGSFLSGFIRSDIYDVFQLYQIFAVDYPVGYQRQLIR